MHRFFARRLSLGLFAFGCGSPGALDRDQFPDLANTGYPDRVGAAGAGLGGASGVAGSVNTGGVGGAAPVGGAGGSLPSGGSGGAVGVSGAGGQMGVSGSSGQAGAGQSGAGNEPGVCPDDITVLLNRPSADGGCAGGGCHVPQGTPPDLTSPGVEARVFNVMSNCGGRPYVGPTDSFIEDKLTNAMPQCGAPMPLFAVNNLSAEDEACILQWIDGLAAGM